MEMREKRKEGRRVGRERRAIMEEKKEE